MPEARFMIVAKVVADTEAGRVWEFQGLFNSRALALLACRDWRYCIAPVTLNEQCPDDLKEFPDCEFPIPRT